MSGDPSSSPCRHAHLPAPSASHPPPVSLRAWLGQPSMSTATDQDNPEQVEGHHVFRKLTSSPILIPRLFKNAMSDRQSRSAMPMLQGCVRPSNDVAFQSVSEGNTGSYLLLSLSETSWCIIWTVGRKWLWRTGRNFAPAVQATVRGKSCRFRGLHLAWPSHPTGPCHPQPEAGGLPPNLRIETVQRYHASQIRLEFHTLVNATSSRNSPVPYCVGFPDHGTIR